MTRTPPKTAEQQIVESKAMIWRILAAWVAVVFLLSLIPLVALSVFLAGLWW
jgi:hypothetical protein